MGKIDCFRAKVIKEMLSILKRYLGDRLGSFGIANDDINAFSTEILNQYLMSDIYELANNDPAAQDTNDKLLYTYENYKGIKAILYYRIAKNLYIIILLLVIIMKMILKITMMDLKKKLMFTKAQENSFTV